MTPDFHLRPTGFAGFKVSGRRVDPPGITRREKPTVAPIIG